MRTFLSDHRVDESVAYDVQLSVHEACANAVEHSDSATDVEIAVRVGTSSVSIAVRDKGRGLDAVHHTDHHRPAQLSLDGRGLYLISRLMDELTVHIDGGTEIGMVKRLS